MLEQLFGFPLYRVSLKQERYSRKKIISTIEKNFKKDPERNEWDSRGDITSVMHHSYSDNINNFLKPDYKSLLPIYKRHIENYLNKLSFSENFAYSFEIVNYTCMKENQYMIPHVHRDCDFSAIHYVQYDEKTNNSTLFYNGNSKFLCNFLEDNRQPLFTKINRALPHNAWMFKNFKFATKEDDLIIFPAYLEHSVPNLKKSKKNRITIAFNISINK